MNQLIETIFNDEITQQGLETLQKKYPVDLKLDMTDDAVFKDGRKTRTECNKLGEAIKRRRLDITGELKEYADEVTAEINRIYSVVVLPFEKENQARKEKAAEEARKHQELIDSEVKKIKAIYEFVDDCRGKDSDHIQGIIEAVDLIETDVFHKDVIHEAIESKKSTLHDLAQLLSDTIAREKTDAERKLLRKQKAEVEELRVKEEKRRFIDQKISDIQMIPSKFFNKPSGDIQNKRDVLESYEIKEAVFGEKVQEAMTIKVNVIDTLNQMLENQLKIEAVELAETKKLEEEQQAIEAEQKAAEEAEGAQEQEEEQPALKEHEGKADQEIESENLPETVEQIQEETPVKDKIEDVKGFLEFSALNGDALNDFGYLFLSDDQELVAQALKNIKDRFFDYNND